MVLRRSWGCSSTPFGRRAIEPNERTSILAECARMRRSTSSCPCSASECLADPRMVQGLPIGPERRFAVRRVVVQGDDEDPVHDGPEGAQHEPVQDRSDGPAERPGASDNSPDERSQPEREQEEEYHPCAENAFLVRSPSVLQQGATATERLQRADALDDYGREDEQGRDSPSGPEDPGDDSTARVGSNR